MTTTVKCRVNGSPIHGAICGLIGCNTNKCHAEPNSCEHQSNYLPPEYETLKHIADGENDYFSNAHIIKLMQADLIVVGNPGFVVTSKGHEILKETTKRKTQ